MELRRRGERIHRILEAHYPEIQSLLKFHNPYELLIAVILSAQTTDAQVNAVIPKLFASFPTPASLATAGQEEVEAIIQSTGFYRVKAHNIRRTAQAIVENHGGEVPVAMEELLKLPGVGRKSANVIRGICFNLPAIIVDTHFKRVVMRLGLVDEKDPSKIEKAVSALLPDSSQLPFSMRINRHGRLICRARRPECVSCPLRPECLYPS